MKGKPKTKTKTKTKNIKKRKRKKKNVHRAKPTIYIPETKIDEITWTLCYHRYDASYIELAEFTPISWKKLRDLIEEFQLYNLNIWYRTKNKYSKENLPYHFPTIDQFTEPQQNKLLKIVLFRPRTIKVKLNQLVRAFTFYAGQTNKEISQDLHLDENFVGRFKRNLIRLIQEGNNKKILEFGIAAGLHQLTEPRGIIQTLAVNYTMMTQPENAKQLAEELELYHIEGFIHRDSILGDVETVKFCNQQIQFLLTDKSLTSLQKQEEIQKYRSLISKIKGKYDHYPGDLLDGQIQNG